MTTELALLDRVHATIMGQVVATGQAPHHTELAAALGIGIDEARVAVADLWRSLPHDRTNALAFNRAQNPGGEQVKAIFGSDIGHFDVLAQTGGSKPDGFEPRRAYVNSKLCNLWFAYELVRRLAAAGVTSKERPISVNAYEPGLVPGSGLARDYPPALRWVWLRVLPAVARVATRLVPGPSADHPTNE